MNAAAISLCLRKKENKNNYKLVNGVEIPVIGFGTWQTPNDEIGVKAVKEALRIGYRHIDTAQGYNAPA